MSWAEIESIQPIVAKMLENSIQKDRLAHAYLFFGPQGTGKKDASILLTKSFFCPQRENHEPCNNCSECRRIDSGNHPDVHWIIPDGASIKKEQIAHLQKEFTYTGLESNKKVYVIEHADRMTTQAANQLLKFLEEPKRETLAILITENLQAILNTIRSRCQLISFKPLNQTNLIQKLLEIGIPESTVRICAAITNDIEEAKRLSEDEWFAKSRSLVIKLVEALYENKEMPYLFLHNQWLPHFQDSKMMQIGLDILLLLYKDIIYYHIEDQDKMVFVNEKERLEKYSFILSQMFAASALKYIVEAKNKLMANVNPTLVMEDLIIHLQR